jgi:copper chaperone CopZ
MFTALLAAAAITTSAHAAVIVANIEGMSCSGCQTKVKDALEGLPFLGATEASLAREAACAELTGTMDEAAFKRAIEDLGYTVATLREADACPASEAGKRRNWGNIDGLDAQVISRGESVDLALHAVEGKFTIVDFGAVWCGPCHAAEALLKGYLRGNPDTAVRAVVLDGDDPETSFSHPAAHQYLMSAAGLPYFIVYNPSGKVIYRGVDVVKVLKKVDRKR